MWKTYNFSQEQAVLYNLEPNSQYFVRVKAFNGATYSTPSTETAFKTKYSRSITCVIDRIHCTQKMVDHSAYSYRHNISFSFIFSYIYVFDHFLFHTNSKETSKEMGELQSAMKDRIKKIDDNSVDYEYENGFGNLPPPTLDAKEFEGVRNLDFPELHRDSILFQGGRNSVGNVIIYMTLKYRRMFPIVHTKLIQIRKLRYRRNI
ncbi:hypothetical protein MXB_4471 [Myxobolus squamalis]|nr:hypothetical protein MXB_4471 [Myxobolus squamalis]